MSTLYSRANEALRLRCVSFFGTDLVWSEIEVAYSEPHRAYHNLNHLRELFETLEPHLEAAPHARAIELAVWFHDFVYRVNLKDYGNNELESAAAMPLVLARAAPSWLQEPMAREVTIASELILATKGHRASSEDLKAIPDAHAACLLFLDADLAILAAPESRFESYDIEIAREWGQDPDNPSQEFCVGRAQAMESFSRRAQLFYSPAFQSLEPAARRNLSKLVQHWRRKATAF